MTLSTVLANVSLLVLLLPTAKAVSFPLRLPMGVMAAADVELDSLSFDFTTGAVEVPFRVCASLPPGDMAAEVAESAASKPPNLHKMTAKRKPRKQSLNILE